MAGFARLPPRAALLPSGHMEDTLVIQGMLGESKAREAIREEGILRDVTPQPTVTSVSPPTRTYVSVSLIVLPGTANVIGACSPTFLLHSIREKQQPKQSLMLTLLCDLGLLISPL